MNLRMHTNRDFETRLRELEHEMKPALTSLWHAPTPRPAFAARLRQQLISTASEASAPAQAQTSSPLRRLSHQRAWGALAAAVAGGVLVTSAALLYRPQPANAEAVLGQLQTEAANSVMVSGMAGCAPAAGTARATTGGMLFIGAGVDNNAPASVSSASDLSDKLAAALGVSGDQVRQAMLETMQSLTPATAPPLDPLAGVATQLGVPESQVCQAFFNSGTPTTITIARGDGKTGFASKSGVGPDGAAQALNLTTANTEQLAPIAARLGVTPERLQAAIKAGVAATTPAQMPAPPSQQQIVSTFARNLGLDQARVQRAITQVEGSAGFYFAVPLPK
jgi:hypothetical protein